MKKTKKAIIFGTGNFAEVVRFYLENDSEYEVVAYTCNKNYIDSDEFKGLPLVEFETLEKQFSPKEYELFIAVGYTKLNKLRENFCREAKKKGYKLLSYICTKATSWHDLQIGENVFIFEDNTIQPFVSIGDGTILWSGNHIGHHSTIGSYNFVSSHVVISGDVKIGNRCFIGVNATISDAVKIADDNLIGPNSLVQKNTKPENVFLGTRSELFKKPSSHFFQ